MEKPVLLVPVHAKIKTIGLVEDNISEAKEYALELNKYYSTLVFTKTQVADAKKERAAVNTTKKKIGAYRKSIIAEYKRPIDLFESTAKETEKILEETSSFIDVQVKKYEDEVKAKKKEKIEKLFKKEAGKLTEFVKFEDVFDEKWLNVTVLMPKVTVQLNDRLNVIRTDMNAIGQLNSPFETELVNIYTKTLDLGHVIMEDTRLKEQKASMDRLKEEQEEADRKAQEAKEIREKNADIASAQANLAKAEDISPEAMEEAKAILQDVEQRPIISQTILFRTALRIMGTDTQMKQLKKFLLDSNMKYEKIEEEVE